MTERRNGTQGTFLVEKPVTSLVPLVQDLLQSLELRLQEDLDVGKRNTEVNEDADHCLLKLRRLEGLPRPRPVVNVEGAELPGAVLDL